MTLGGSVSPPWDVLRNLAELVSRYLHVSSECRMILREELQLLDSALVKKLLKHSNGRIHDYRLSLVKNRLAALKARTAMGSNGGRPVEAKCQVPPRVVRKPWLHRFDKTVFGEKYSSMVQIWDAQGLEDELQGKTRLGVAPPGGWLHVLLFHTLWSSPSQSQVEALRDLAPALPFVSFLGLGVNSLEMMPVARRYKVDSFPTILVLRGEQVLRTFHWSTSGSSGESKAMPSKDEAAMKEMKPLRRRERT